MNNTELLDNLQKDLNELAVPKKAHIQIEQILNHYKQRVAEQKPNETIKPPKNEVVGKDNE